LLTSSESFLGKGGKTKGQYNTMLGRGLSASVKSTIAIVLRERTEKRKDVGFRRHEIREHYLLRPSLSNIIASPNPYYSLPIFFLFVSRSGFRKLIRFFQ
jgi:hypothetical protein